MDLLNTGIFDLAERRLNWLDRRQQVLAQNVANADTPHYQSSDVPAFAATLQKVSAQTASVLTQTAPGHMAGQSGTATGAQTDILSGRRKAHAPDGNGVALDEELTKVADVQNMQSLTSGLYTKYLGMFRLALGRGA